MATRARILGADVPIVEDDRLLAEGDAVGEARFTRNVIAIDPRVDAPGSGETLIHEAVETINHKLELDLKHRQIQALSSAIYQFMRDNPTLMRAIRRGERIPPPTNKTQRRRAKRAPAVR